MNWSIIIFSYNEGENLVATVQQCAEFLSYHAESYEMILVDDGSSDNTPKVCERLSEEFSALRILRHASNLGIGNALRTGYANACHQYVCAIPGDGQFDPNELVAVPAFGPNEFYTFVRKSQNYTLYRQALSTLNRIFNRWFLGLTMRDVNWIKVYRIEQLRFANPQLRSSVIESEICGRLFMAGISPVELPSTYLTRAHGDAKGGRWKTVRQVIQEPPRLYLMRFSK